MAERKPKKLDDLRIKVNGEWNGYLTDGKHALGYILSMGMDSLKYMSFDGIVNYIKEALNSVEELLEWHDDASLKRRIMICRKALLVVDTRERAMDLYINITLSCDGFGTLSGFGMANIESKGGRSKLKSKIKLNPEKNTIYFGG
jgi:hypothetical protein